MRLDQPGAGAIVAGDADASEMWKRVNAADAADRMPPEGSNKKPLSAEEKELTKEGKDG